MQIDNDLGLLQKGESSLAPYQSFHDLAWNTWKSVILAKDSRLAAKVDKAYFYVPIVNNFLCRMEEFKWGLGVSHKETFENTKQLLSEELLPQLKEAEEALRKES